MEKPRRRKGLYETGPRVALILFAIAIAIMIGMIVLAQRTQRGDAVNDTSRGTSTVAHHDVAHG